MIGVAAYTHFQAVRKYSRLYGTSRTFGPGNRSSSFFLVDRTEDVVKSVCAAASPARSLRERVRG